jgi:hypothetical protein
MFSADEMMIDTSSSMFNITRDCDKIITTSSNTNKIPQEILDKYFGQQDLYMKYSQKKEQNFLQSLHEPFKRAYDALFDSNLLNFPRFLLDGGPQHHSLMEVMQQDLMECRFNSVCEFESFIDTMLTSGVAFSIKEMS